MSRFQVTSATVALIPKNTSFGVLKPRHFLGRLFNLFITLRTSLSVTQQRGQAGPKKIVLFCWSTSSLWAKGVLNEKHLLQFHRDATKISGHPPPPDWLPEIPVATGSLGHGFPMSCEIALAKKVVKVDNSI